MSDLDDFDLGKPDEPELDIEGRGELEVGATEVEAATNGVPARSPLVPILAAVATIVIGAAAVLTWLLLPRKPAETPPPSAAAAPAVEPSASPEASPEASPPVSLPGLDASDALVRDLAKGLSSRPELAAWLATDALVRKFVAVVDNVADGASPAPHLKFLAPKDRFRAAGDGFRFTLDPKGYDRYDTVAQVVASLDAAGSARLYGTLQPLLTEAYRDLGYPQGDFSATLERAIARLVRTPVVEKPIALVPHGLSYRFAEPKLESLSAAQKHLLRMGPRNQSMIQSKLREIAAALGIPAERLPS
jgi:Protein of unknown function (DUF3014)